MTIAASQFTWNEYAWAAELTFRSWSGFQSRRGAYGSIDSDHPSNGDVSLVFAPEGRGDEPLTDAELSLVQCFLDHESETSQAVVRALIQVYPRLQEEFDYSPDERTEYMPDIAAAEDLRELIGLHTVYVHQVSRSGSPYVGFEFGCQWDEEHGIGVLMHGERTVKIGGADTAFLLWIAEKDAAKR